MGYSSQRPGVSVPDMHILCTCSNSAISSSLLHAEDQRHGLQNLLTPLLISQTEDVQIMQNLASIFDPALPLKSLLTNCGFETEQHSGNL